MKTCPNCRNPIADDALFCPICGTTIGAAPQFEVQEAATNFYGKTDNYNQLPMDAPVVPCIDPYDHTKDFDSLDVSENKVVAMLAYLLGPIGIMIALLSSANSKYAKFHIKQAMKLTVTEVVGIILLTFAGYLMWILRLRSLMFFMVTVCLIGLVCLHLICFLQVCRGKAIEVYFVRKLQFLK